MQIKKLKIYYRRKRFFRFFQQHNNNKFKYFILCNEKKTNKCLKTVDVKKIRGIWQDLVRTKTKGNGHRTRHIKYIGYFIGALFSKKQHISKNQNFYFIK